MVYSRDVGAAFDPTDLGEDVTPAAARSALKSGDYRRALLMALRLRGADADGSLTREVGRRCKLDVQARPRLESTTRFSNFEGENDSTTQCFQLET